jgi:hypothetical protein
MTTPTTQRGSAPAVQPSALDPQCRVQLTDADRADLIGLLSIEHCDDDWWSDYRRKDALKAIESGNLTRDAIAFAWAAMEYCYQNGDWWGKIRFAAAHRAMDKRLALIMRALPS